ncbi:hypothetical protein M9H77_25647 [Catharanthus roseus]|uniref:Uncharacterized protein n=1 Tax=Catharanthus roseus TaxID=4058 RepID=A0ACC0A8A2_CATRO|nr:hypothetical protein M9H77_25647 [Catharanthus roseus]
MKEIQERNVDAYIYLMKLGPEKWTLLHDGGHRHGIMTPTFLKHLTYFHQHREEAENCVHPFPIRIFDKFLRIEMKSREHKVTTYNPRERIYMVKSLIRVSGTGNNLRKMTNIYIALFSCSCSV